MKILYSSKVEIIAIDHRFIDHKQKKQTNKKTQCFFKASSLPVVERGARAHTVDN